MTARTADGSGAATKLPSWKALARTVCLPGISPPKRLQPAGPTRVRTGLADSELYGAQFTPRQPWPSAPRRLPGVGRLPADQRLGLGLDQVSVALSRLVASAPPEALAPVTMAPVRVLFEEVASRPQDGHGALYRLHVATLQTLSAIDFRLGKAYSLGRALADSARVTDAPHDFAETFGRLRLDTLRARLNDLASALPPHSAGAVLQSLTRWEAWAANFAAARPANTFADGERSELGVILSRQGELWRAVLSGEKCAVDMLSSDDYRRAAGTLLGRARRSLARTSLPLLVVMIATTAIVIAGVLLLVSNDTTRAVATISAAAGALGITFKSASAVLQRAARTLERPLWGAAVNAAVAEAVTYLPPADAFKGRLPESSALGPPRSALHFSECCRTCLTTTTAVL